MEDHIRTKISRAFVAAILPRKCKCAFRDVHCVLATAHSPIFHWERKKDATMAGARAGTLVQGAT